MIKVHRLGGNDPDLVINSDLIETVETTPDTVITLTTGHKIIVHEPMDEVIRKVVEFKRQIFLGPEARREQ